MKLSNFDYEYPKELIAQRPLPCRDASRMMVIDRRFKKFEHTSIKHIFNYLKPGDLVVFNNSKVVPARLFGKRENGETVEILVVESSDNRKLWRCLLKKAKRIRAGEKFFFGMQATATARGRDEIFLLIEFPANALDLAIKYHGVPPLPPYIEREGFSSYSKEDRDRYQTIFASAIGSAAAPTAGLHFSEELFAVFAQKKINTACLTLHVGIDTFAPVRAEDISEHRMHGERYEITTETATLINQTKAENRRVIACGTTTVRALESAASYGKIKPGKFTTHLFIKPGHEFQIVDAMLTNFHQPKSTLLVLVSAFAGREFILSCYNEAIGQNYRLFSYGDCMLIL